MTAALSGTAPLIVLLAAPAQPVARITKNGIRCRLFMQRDGDSDNNKIDNIEVPSRRDVTDTR